MDTVSLNDKHSSEFIKVTQLANVKTFV